MGVKGDEINLCTDAFEQFCQVPGILITVIDLLDQNIFKGDPLSFGKRQRLTCPQESLQRIFIVYGHKQTAGVIVRCI